MKFLIHACPSRTWYVQEFLYPSLLAQGADPADVEIWNDAQGKGNLRSCMESFAARTGDGGTWHLQDDVILCSDFLGRCRRYDEGVAYGFACRNFGDRLDAYGTVYVPDAWNSFQCVRIPDKYAGECAEWFFTDAAYRETYHELVSKNKGDDSIWYDFLTECHLEEQVTNLNPSIVEHVDFLLGGSVINKWRGYAARGDLWEDDEAVEKLKDKLARR